MNQILSRAFKIYQPVNLESDSKERDEDVTFTDLTEVLFTETDGQFTLPPHMCESHIIIPFNTNDIEKYLICSADKTAVCRSGIMKCTDL